MLSVVIDWNRVTAKKLVFTWMIVIVLPLYIYARWPISLNMDYPAVRYRLGVENKGEVSQIHVSINGKIKKDFLLRKRFKGYIDISGIDDLNIEPVKIQYSDVELDMRIDDFNRGSLTYFDYKKHLQSHSPGTIYFDPTFSNLTIGLYEFTKGSDGTKHGSWSGSDGITVSAPATNREEALAITNAIFKEMNDKASFE